MNDSDPKLLEALRAVAAIGPREAHACVEERLLREFRRRSHARRRNLWLGVGMGAIAAGIAVLLWVRPAALLPNSPAPSTARVGVPAAQKQVASFQAPPKPASVRRAHRRSAEVAVNFYRLPDFDELPPMESATIVRVQLPLSSLRLIGLPVSEEQAGESIQADMLVGQDGLARGVRFVQ